MLASSFMTIIVPRVAGVERIVACAPPQKDRGIDPTMLMRWLSPALTTSSVSAGSKPWRR